MRMEMEKDRYEDAARDARGHLERYNKLKHRLEQIEDERESELADAMTALENVPWEKDNPAIQEWSDEIGMSPTDLIKQLEDYHAE